MRRIMPSAPMRTLRRARLLLCLAAGWGVAGFALAQEAPAPEAAGAPAPDTPAAGPQVAHFGFYASAMGHWNFTEALAPYTTLTWVHVYGGDDPVDGARRLVDRVREAREHGVQAVLSLEPFLFADPRGTPRSDEAIETFLVELRARLEQESLLDAVLMLYPKDEPFREFRRARDPNFVDEYVTGTVYDDIAADLDRVLDHLAAVFPEIPVGVILSGLELHHRFFQIPAGYDWVGFNCYASLFEACEGRSFIQLYGRLLAHMTPGQRLIAVPEAWALHGATERDDFPVILAQRLAHHWEMVMAEPRFVAVIPFIWSFDAPSATPGIGLDRFPETWDERSAGAGTAFRDAMLDLGSQIKRGDIAYPNLPWSATEDHPARSEALEEGRIAELTLDGRVRVEALDRALPHKNLRIRLNLLDAKGKSLYRGPVVRTDRFVPVAVPDFPEDGVLLGTHGFEWQIPVPLLVAQADRELTVELVTYADGPGERVAHRTVRRLTPLPVPLWPFRSGSEPVEYGRGLPGPVRPLRTERLDPVARIR